MDSCSQHQRQLGYNNKCRHTVRTSRMRPCPRLCVDPVTPRPAWSCFGNTNPMSYRRCTRQHRTARSTPPDQCRCGSHQSPIRLDATEVSNIRPRRACSHSQALSPKCQRSLRTWHSIPTCSHRCTVLCVEVTASPTEASLAVEAVVCVRARLAYAALSLQAPVLSHGFVQPASAAAWPQQ